MVDVSRDYGRLIKSAIKVSVILAVILTAAKAAVWLFSGSETMLASLADSVMDGLGASITFFAVRYSLNPPDGEHNYGHGKAEAVAGLFQAFTVGFTVVLVIWHSIEKLVQPEALTHTAWALVVTGISMLLEAVVILYQGKIIRLTGSAAVKADNIHIRADFLFNCGVLLSLTLVNFTGIVRFDSVFAIILGLLILVGAFRIGLVSVNMLLDRNLPERITEGILRTAMETGGVLSVHGLRTRQAGKVRFVQMHLVMDGGVSLEDAHRISDQVEQQIKEAYPGTDVIIHAEPMNNAAQEEADERSTFGG